MVRKLRRLPWAANEAYLVRCLIGAARARVGAAPLAASLAAGLARYHPSLGVALADAVLEEACPGRAAPCAGRSADHACGPLVTLPQRCCVTYHNHAQLGISGLAVPAQRTALSAKQLAQPFTSGLLHAHTIGCSAAMVQGASAACPMAQGRRAERQDLEGA